MNARIEPIPFPADEWRTIEIIANKNRITTSMNGKGLDSKVDSEYPTGGLALTCWGRIQIQEILITRLPDNSASTSPAR